MVIELNPIGQLFGMGPLVPIVSQYDPHPITKDLAGVMTLFPLTRSFEAVKTPPKGTSDPAARQDQLPVLGRDGQVGLHQGRGEAGRK